ncbi:MAG: RluA family pseudouridine synthase [Oscillospiraceae bacterium]|nr:RluA family pseudouridine synthase [Oscillospiraceae bacterium]
MVHFSAPADKRIRQLALTVAAAQAGSTVKHLLKTEFHMADGFISSLKQRPDGILLQGKQAHTVDHVREGDVLSVRIDDPGPCCPAVPVPVPLVVFHEDEDLIILEKPAGMLVCGTPGGAVTLADALASHLGPDQPVHPVQRLDRWTSGLIVFAKSRYISDRIRRSLHSDRFIREYLALAEGQLDPPDGRIDIPIGPADARGIRRCARSDGQPAVTDYKTVSAFSGGSILKLRLQTGRTHQIRVHLSAVGHPLFGDSLYGAADPAPGRTALHSAHLVLLHPVTGESLNYYSCLPEDLQQFLRLRHVQSPPQEILFPL